jgi:hypothetical protein
VPPSCESHGAQSRVLPILSAIITDDMLLIFLVGLGDGEKISFALLESLHARLRHPPVLFRLFPMKECLPADLSASLRS